MSIGGKIYPDLLWGEDFGTDLDAGRGSLVRTRDDFILAAGPGFSGEPPPSMGSFPFESRTITNSGLFNNEIVRLLQTGKKSDRKKAEVMLKSGIQFDPRFFPFRYNYGRLLYLDQSYDLAIEHFEFAKSEIPAFFKTYIHLGNLYFLKNDSLTGVQNFRLAVERNPWDTEALVLLAEHFMDTGLRNRARQYLDKALEIEDGSPNARLGLARLEIQAGNHYRAYKILNETELYSPEGKIKLYDKKFHYYFAETASKVQDYEIASEEYDKMLSFPNDPFFGSFSYKVLQRRRDIAKRFADIKRTQLDQEESQGNFR
jgi:tetratricopeptide (TPR) repeat protein